MANWTISPCGEGIATPCSCDDGNFTISPNVKSGKSFKITYTDGEKVKTIDYVREKECITCECSDIIFTYGATRYFNVAAHNDVELGTIKFKEGTTCANYVRVSGDTGSTGFTEIKIVGDKVIASFPAYQQTFLETGRRLRFKFTIEGTPCTNVYEIYQQAWRGTDNGTDTFINGYELQYPILLCYCKGRCDADTIIAQNGAWYYNEATELCEKIEPSWGGVIIDGWCHFFCKKNQPGYCDKNMISCKALSANKTGKIRKAFITLSSIPSKDALEDATVICQNAGDVHHSGETCSLTWKYEVWQLPKGYSMLYQDNGIDFELLTNGELQTCLDYNNCKYIKNEDCRNHETDECDCDND